MYSHRANHEFNLDLENNIHEDNVEVCIKNGLIHGTVRCVICEMKKTAKNKLKQVHHSSNSNFPCWVVSNYAKHLKTVHHLRFHELETNLDELPEKSDDPTECKPDELFDRSRTSVSSNYKSDHSVVCLNDSVKIACKSSQHTEVSNILYTQLSNQITLMMSAALKNSESQETIHFKLSDDVSQSLIVALIPGDGNCLFSSLTHQLENKRISGKNHQAATNKLRADVVKYILDNYSKFSHQLRNRVFELKEKIGSIKSKAKKKREDKDVTIDTECKLFVKLALSQTNTWGGAETIHAVSEMKQVNIVLFNEDGPYHMLTNINAKYNRSICIAYRQAWTEYGEVNKTLRNYYDSVCDVDSKVLYNAVQTIASKQK